jgi:bisphosphoglycerate-dependent phosphoglycerate mutase
MYGGLQGLNKSETAAKYGEDQVKVKKNTSLLFFVLVQHYSKV